MIPVQKAVPHVVPARKWGKGLLSERNYRSDRRHILFSVSKVPKLQNSHPKTMYVDIYLRIRGDNYDREAYSLCDTDRQS